MARNNDRKRGRPEHKIDPNDGPAAALAIKLRELREKAGGPTYEQMSTLVPVSRSALSDAARGRRFPTWDVVAGYVVACGGNPAEWRSVWEQLRSLDNAPPVSTSAGQPDPSENPGHDGPGTRRPNSRPARLPAYLAVAATSVVAAAIFVAIQSVTATPPSTAAAPTVTIRQSTIRSGGGCTTYDVQGYSVGVHHRQEHD